MVELVAKSPCADLLPLVIDDMRLEEADLGVLTSIAPFQGQAEALSKTLRAAHGVDFPEPNTASANEDTRIIWFGRDMALLAGPQPNAGLSDHAALTDQSDAWGSFVLSGPKVSDVMARLTPVDLRPQVFGDGQTCRTLVNHMTASITRLSADSVLILVFRSMTATLVEELQEAMEAVAARG